MDTNIITRQLEALGNPTRLAVFRQLCKAGKTGLNVGNIRNIVDVPASTLSHHITRLVTSGLVSQTRKGRQLVCTANQNRMDELVMYLANECCGEDSSVWQ